MNYTPPNTPPNTAGTQPSGQVQNWSQQTDTNLAKERAEAMFKGGQAIDAQLRDGHYLVHLRDSRGHFETVTLDTNLALARMEPGYC